MIYQKYCKNRGIILIDILVAISLGAFIIFTLHGSSQSARDIFERAEERDALMDVFEKHLDGLVLAPYGSKIISDSIVTSTGTSSIEVGAIGRWFGNDRVETDIILRSNVNDIQFGQKIYSQSMSFVEIRSALPTSTIEIASTPVCSPDYSKSNTYGSYESADLSATIEIRQINLPINPLLPLTDIEVRNNTAFVSSDSAMASDPDLFVFDISNTDNPIQVASINTGPGISSIAIVGKRIYAAARSTVAQLHVIRFDDGWSNPILESTFALLKPYASSTRPYSSSIYYENNRVYLGTEKWDGEEFIVIDVSNPANSMKVGSFEIGSKVNDMWIKNNVGYIASSNIEQLRVIDLTDPNSPIEIASFSPSGSERQDGKIISSFEGHLNFGRTSGGYDRIQDHELFDWATTSATTLAVLDSINSSGGVYGIVRDRSHLYVITRAAGNEFAVIDMPHDPNIIGFGTTTPYSLPIIPQTLTCDGNRLFILAHSAPVIYELSFK